MSQMVNSLRRAVLRGSASLPVASLVTSLGALHARTANAADGVSTLIRSPYGPLSPVADQSTGLPLLMLPAGFTYKSYGWTGDMMADRQPCPGSHDGMAVVRTRKVGRSTEMVLIRNHERGATATPINAAATYDTGIVNAANGTLAGGGTTNLVFRDGEWVEMRASLAGTLTNCAGGPTPWGTWLTCEEVGTDAVSTAGRRHGYVFEVSANAGETTGQPIIGMGRYAHEAAAVDPVTGIVYLTEDSNGRSGFYRYVPNDPTPAYGALARGGRLEMAKVRGQDNVTLFGALVDQSWDLEWVTIEDPDANRGPAVGVNGTVLNANAAGPFVEGWRKGALAMRRGEGIWFAPATRSMFIVDTNAGAAGEGTVLELDLATQRLTCVYSSTGAATGNNPDNITISPRGGILVCEDGGSAPAIADSPVAGSRLMALNRDGDTYVFCRNNVNLTAAQLAAAGKSTALAGDRRDSEFCGACFDPSGRVLFVNIQTPGITFAISGPWARGSL